MKLKKESLGSFEWHNTKGSKPIFVFSLHKSHFITKSCPGRQQVPGIKATPVTGIILGQLPAKGGGGLEQTCVGAALIPVAFQDFSEMLLSPCPA